MFMINLYRPIGTPIDRRPYGFVYTIYAFTPYTPFIWVGVNIYPLQAYRNADKIGGRMGLSYGEEYVYYSKA